jgi:hypothetical protein
LGKHCAECTGGRGISGCPSARCLHRSVYSGRSVFHYGLPARTLENRPPEPERLAVCHGDFHALNILYADGKVTGVLDWPGFAIADPVFDVANSIVLITISGKHLAASMGDFSSVDWDLVADLYLAAYRTHRSLDDTNLDYYRVRRCVMALVQGFEGQKVWQHPLIVRDLLAYILDITGIQIPVPDRDIDRGVQSLQ